MGKYKGKRKSAIKAISAIYRFSQIYLGVKLSEFNIGKSQWYFLSQLAFENDGLYQEEISRILFTDKGNTAKALKKLEDEGYIYREEDPKYARRKRVYVTEKTRLVKDDFHLVFKDLNQVLLKDFTKEERETFLQLIYKIFDNINDYREFEEELDL